MRYFTCGSRTRRRPLLLASMVWLASALAGAADSRIQVIDRAMIFRHTGTNFNDPTNTTGFNHAPSIAVLPDGRLLTTWFAAPFEGAPQQRIMGSFSSDQGKTWTAAATLQDFDGKADFDPSLVVSGQQTFLFFSVTGPLKIFYRSSADSGRTWAPPVEIGQPNHTTRANGIRLSTGELLVPLHLRGTKAGGVMKSIDGGRTWTRYGAVATPKGEGGEPTIAQLKSGKIMMVLRTRDGEVWRSLSSDKGETWEPPQKTGLTGTSSAAHLLCTRDGTLVLTHNPSREVKRYPLTLRTSQDDGATWSEPIVLADRPTEEGGWSVTYPNGTELSDGTLVVVWTQIKSSAQEKYGDIHAARIRLSAGRR